MPLNSRRNSREDKSKKRKSNSESFNSKDNSKRSFSKKDNKKSFAKASNNKSFSKSMGKGRFSKSDKASSQHLDHNEENVFKYTKYRKVRQPSKPAIREAKDDGLIRLNRYIANAGICSRRKADELIAAGVITVNGEVVTSLGTKVDPAKDEIRYNNERLKREQMVYILLNKPKDYITTTDDPQERRTVMQLVAKATKERIYPVGRLDRNTTGLLLLTNDGQLAEKLSHPRNNVTKIYHVELNKNLTQGDFNKIQ